MGKVIENLKLQSYDDLFKSTQEGLDDSMESQVVDIPINELYEFKNHPFRVLDDDKMDETVASIKANGVLVPAMARARKEGGYELISGHRRRRACEIAGIEKMPVIIKNLTDDEATIIMVDSNIQRESLLISEKAKAYAMKYHAEKRQGKASGVMLEKMSKEYNESEKQIQRYIWIARLLPGLLDLLDEGLLGFTQGTDLSFLNEEQQASVLLVLKMYATGISIKQSAEIKRLGMTDELTSEKIMEILVKKDVVDRKFVLSEKKISMYFDNSYTKEDIEKIIIEFLESRMKGEVRNGNS